MSSLYVVENSGGSTTKTQKTLPTATTATATPTTEQRTPIYFEVPGK